MTKCYKCHETCTSVGSFDEKFKCGLCKDYDGGFVNSNPFLSSHCDCRNVLCLECMQKKCHKCGSIKRKKAVNHCKYCKKEIRERIDNSDNDRRGNWIDSNGKVIGSCEECIDCGNKTTCQNCAKDTPISKL